MKSMVAVAVATMLMGCAGSDESAPQETELTLLYVGSSSGAAPFYAAVTHWNVACGRYIVSSAGGAAGQIELHEVESLSEGDFVIKPGKPYPGNDALPQQDALYEPYSDPNVLFIARTTRIPVDREQTVIEAGIGQLLHKSDLEGCK